MDVLWGRSHVGATEGAKHMGQARRTGFYPLETRVCYGKQGRKVCIVFDYYMINVTLCARVCSPWRRGSPRQGGEGGGRSLSGMEDGAPKHATAVQNANSNSAASP